MSPEQIKPKAKAATKPKTAKAALKPKAAAETKAPAKKTTTKKTASQSTVEPVVKKATARKKPGESTSRTSKKPATTRTRKTANTAASSTTETAHQPATRKTTGPSTRKKSSSTTTSRSRTSNKTAKTTQATNKPRARKRSTATKPQFLFNFGWVKKQAKAGSWRRGYDYFKANKIQKYKHTEHGIEAKVKGNYKQVYTIKLEFDAETITPECTCPLTEPWCKHAVSVALKTIEDKEWEAYWHLPTDEFKRNKDVIEVLDLYDGSYRIFLSPKRKNRRISIKFLDRQTGRLVKHLEELLTMLLEYQASGDYQFNEATIAEIQLMKYIYAQGQVQARDGWYHLPVNEANEIFTLLSHCEEVCTTDYEQILFEHDPLKLIMSVNVSMAGNVLISLHWHQQNPDNAYPLDEITLFGTNCLFGLYKNQLFPLSNRLDMLPGKIGKHAFLDIRDADGGKFMYEQLPKLRKLVEINESEISQQLRLKKSKPQKVVKLDIPDPVTMKIRIALEFDYGGTRVPYSKGTSNTPYIMVTKKKEELIYWVKRDPALEKEAYETLSTMLEPIQTNYFAAEGDGAIDFYHLVTKTEKDDWIVDEKENDDFSVLKLADHPLKVWANIDFAASVDFFDMKIQCRIGKDVMDLDDVRTQMLQGKKYFLLPGQGFVEIPLATILQFSRTLQILEAEKIEDPSGLDTYRTETYKVGLIGELTEYGVELDMGEKFNAFWNLVTGSATMDDVTPPDNVKAELRPYQKEGFNWLWFLYTYGLNGILADDMGLGKTLQTLTLIQHAKNTSGAKPTLVVCPSTIVYNWINEAKKFTPDLNIISLTGPDRIKTYRKIAEADIVITSYAIMRRDIRSLKEYDFRHVILDESQNIKNWDSQTAKAAKKLKSNHRLALSGTPIENRLLELWSVFDFLMPKFLYTIEEFKYHYVAPIEEQGNIDTGRRLKRQVFPFILRRLKKDVAKDLPPKIETVNYCELTPKQQEVYLDILDNTRDQVFSNISESSVDSSRQSIFEALLRLRQLCCHPKLLDDKLSQGVTESGKFEALKSMVKELVAEGHRVLFYSQFVEMLKIVRSWLETEGIRYEYLTGETPTHKRGGIVDRFNQDEDIPIFLISLKAGGTGLNLTGADYVILYDPWWNPAAENQAADRAHRIGQTKTVMVYRFVTKGTVEEKILKLQERKQDLVDSIISTDKGIGKLLSVDDLKDILTPDF